MFVHVDVYGDVYGDGDVSLGERTGWKRLPKRLPRPVYAAAYMLLVITALTSLSVTIVPRLTVSNQPCNTVLYMHLLIMTSSSAEVYCYC